MAQSKESKFFLSGRVSPSLSEANLHPKRCIPRILNNNEKWVKREIEELDFGTKEYLEHIPYYSVPSHLRK